MNRLFLTGILIALLFSCNKKPKEEMNKQKAKAKANDKEQKQPALDMSLRGKMNRYFEAIGLTLDTNLKYFIVPKVGCEYCVGKSISFAKENYNLPGVIYIFSTPKKMMSDLEGELDGKYNSEQFIIDNQDLASKYMVIEGKPSVFIFEGDSLVRHEIVPDNLEQVLSLLNK